MDFLGAGKKKRANNWCEKKTNSRCVRKVYSLPKNNVLLVHEVLSIESVAKYLMAFA